MQLGRVKGTAICTMKYPGMQGLKLLVVQPLNKNLQPVGLLQVAVDTVQAGSGDLCVLIRSREASLALPEPQEIPVDLALVGIVDQFHLRPDDEFDLIMHSGWNPYS